MHLTIYTKDLLGHMYFGKGEKNKYFKGMNCQLHFIRKLRELVGIEAYSSSLVVSWHIN